MEKAKYKKGDVVYVPENIYTDKHIKCPDCLGEKVWMVVFPSGQVEYPMCQTCKRGYEPASGEICIPEWKCSISTRTVGSVRYDDTDKVPYSYMCEETGVGSGRIYKEVEMFLTKDEAQKLAEEKFLEQQLGIAKNNFKTKKDIERMLSTYGYTRSIFPKVTADFKKWIGLAKNQ